MSTTTNTPRLLAAAKEFNIGKDTLVEFLTDKGFEINSSPSTKLTEQMYNALQVEFAQDKDAKRRSDQIALPKGSLLDGLKKSKDELDITVKDKKEEPAAKPKEEKPKEVEKPKVAEAPKEEPAKVVPPPAPTPAPVKEQPVVKEVPVAKEEAPAPPPVPEAPKPAAEPVAQEPGHVEIKAPKIEGPNILGKINLDELNLSSRPKKGAAVAKKKRHE